MSDRSINWKSFLNKLQYCYGCGRFGMPRREGQKVVPPRGWTVLYQPHPDAPAGLLVCSVACREKVNTAMVEGPIYEPLEVATNITMSTEMREQMMREAMQFAIEQGRLDDLFDESVEDQGNGEEE